MNDMDDTWNFQQNNLRSYKPRFLHRNLREHVTRTKDDPFICNLHSPEKYKCQRCHFQSDLKILLTKHFNTVHERKETEHYKNSVLRYCEKCGFQTRSSLVLLSHDKSCDKNGNTSLGYIQIKTAHELYGDVKKSLGYEEEEDQNKMRFLCEHCFYRSIRKKCLKVHLRVMHPSLDQTIWYRCDQCSYKTKRNGHLNRHLDAHLASKWRGKTRNAVTHLPTDVKKSLEEDEEEKRSSQPNQSKILRFQCDHCSYKSAQKHFLRVHLRTVHPSLDQSVWHRCEHCSYKTKHGGHLNRHLSWLHHPLGPKNLTYFKCEKCSYEHINILKVRSHMQRVHTPTEQIGLNVNSARAKSR